MFIRSFAKAPKFSALQDFVVVIQTGSKTDIIDAYNALTASPLFQTKGWRKALSSFAAVIAYDAAAFTVFAEGNSKLPFYAFSTLPGVTCPGAGECIAFCYSYRAWRYPSAFFRQCQNAYLLRFAPSVLTASFANVMAENPNGFDFRLYVDGDFSSQSDVEFWMTLLQAAPMVKAYGYSKSFALLLSYVNNGGVVPDNYRLNISSGHNADDATVSAIRKHSFVRGDFVAVSIGRKIKASDYGTKAVNDALRSRFDAKIFPCPGKCGSCTNVGHACGSDVFKGRIIAIAVH